MFDLFRIRQEAIKKLVESMKFSDPITAKWGCDATPFERNANVISVYPDQGSFEPRFLAYYAGSKWIRRGRKVPVGLSSSVVTEDSGTYLVCLVFEGVGFARTAEQARVSAKSRLDMSIDGMCPIGEFDNALRIFTEV